MNAPGRWTSISALMLRFDGLIIEVNSTLPSQ
jgi:hypothetical protein